MESTYGQYIIQYSIGYDLATGLGSIDAFEMVTNWTSVTAAGTGNATSSVDFSLAFSPTQLTLKKGSCGTAQLLLTPLNGFSGTPSFSCTVSSTLGSTTCSVAPGAASSLLAPGKFKDPDWRSPAAMIVILLLAWVLVMFSASRPFSVSGRPGQEWTKLVPAASLLLLCAIFLSCGGGGGGASSTSGGNNAVSTSGGNKVSAIAPSVTTQPMSQTITEGQPATFSVSATGTAPLSYQWTKNGTAISGATASTYTTPATTPSDQGDQFSVSVSNSAGRATSNAATLTVNAPYNFVVQVPSTTAAGSGTLTVTAQIGGISHSAQIALNVN